MTTQIKNYPFEVLIAGAERRAGGSGKESRLAHSKSYKEGCGYF
jgi:hypothetical protein